MTVEFKSGINIADWKRQLKEKVAKVLDAETQIAATGIKIRTQKGEDVDGNQFKPYSPGYAAQREKAKRQIDHVDLLFTGKMQKSINTRVEPTMGNSTTGVISVTSDQADKVRGNEKRGRKFFKLSKEQIRSIVEKLKRIKLIG